MKNEKEKSIEPQQVQANYKVRGQSPQKSQTQLLTLTGQFYFRLEQ